MRHWTLGGKVAPGRSETLPEGLPKPTREGFAAAQGPFPVRVAEGHEETVGEGSSGLRCLHRQVPAAQAP